MGTGNKVGKEERLGVLGRVTSIVVDISKTGIEGETELAMCEIQVQKTFTWQKGGESSIAGLYKSDEGWGKPRTV